jgi:hypothetical protein
VERATEQPRREAGGWLAADSNADLSREVPFDSMALRAGYSDKFPGALQKVGSFMGNFVDAM